MNFDEQAVSGLLNLLFVMGLVYWVVVLVLAAVAYAWFQLNRRVKHWQEQADRQMNDINASLGRMETEITAIERAAQPYSPNDREPYGATATELHSTLTEVQQVHDDQTRQFDDLSKNTPGTPGNFLARFLFGLGPEFYQWRQHAQRVESLFRATQQLQDRVDEAKSLLERLDNRPLEVALLARELQQNIKESLQIAKELVASGVYSAKLSVDRNYVKQLAGKLLLIPSYFRHDPDDLVKQRYRKEDVISAWSILEEIENPSAQYLEKFQHWQSEYKTIGQRLAEVREEINTIETRLDEMSSSIGPLPLTEVRELENTIQELDKSFHDLPIEEIDDFDIDVIKATAEANLRAQEVKDIEEKLEKTQKKSHQVMERLEALVMVHEDVSWVKKYKGRVVGERKLLKECGCVSNVRNHLETLIKIYDQMMRRAERQIWGYMKGSVAV